MLKNHIDKIKLELWSLFILKDHDYRNTIQIPITFSMLNKVIKIHLKKIKYNE